MIPLFLVNTTREADIVAGELGIRNVGEIREIPEERRFEPIVAIWAGKGLPKGEFILSMYHPSITAFIEDAVDEIEWAKREFYNKLRRLGKKFPLAEKRFQVAEELNRKPDRYEVFKLSASIEAFDLNPFAPNIEEFLRRFETKYASEHVLSMMFPNLVFIPGNLPGFTDTDNAFWKAGYDGEFKFKFPPSKGDMEKLAEMNSKMGE